MPLCGGNNGTNRSHLSVSSVDVAFTCCFVATCMPLSFHSMAVLVVLAMSATMAGNSASYPFYGWWIDTLQLAIE